MVTLSNVLAATTLIPAISNAAVIAPTTSVEALAVATMLYESNLLTTDFIVILTPAPVETSPSTTSSALVPSQTIVGITGSATATCDGQGDACTGDVTYWDGGKFSLSPLLNLAILTYPQDLVLAAQMSIQIPTWQLHCQLSLWVRSLTTIPTAEIQSHCTIRTAGRLCRPLSKTSAKVV
jgi:hypothetical protein